MKSVLLHSEEGLGSSGIRRWEITVQEETIYISLGFLASRAVQGRSERKGVPVVYSFLPRHSD
jgi:hypothetical protein